MSDLLLIYGVKLKYFQQMLMRKSKGEDLYAYENVSNLKTAYFYA